MARWKIDALGDSVATKIVIPVKEAVAAGMEGFKAAMGMLSEAERGPKDYEVENDLERGIRIGRGLAPRSYNNGGDDESIKRWHLVLAVLGIVLPIVGAAWSLSMQISAQSAMITNIRDHQREQDERTTRIEQQLQQLPRR